MKFLRFIAPVVLFVPAIASAQEEFGKLGGVFRDILNIINNTIIPLFIAIAFLAFIWGVFQWVILGSSDPNKRKDGQQFMLWSIIGFVVIVSLWGIVNLISGGFGFSDNTIDVPTVPSGNQ